MFFRKKGIEAVNPFFLAPVVPTREVLQPESCSVAGIGGSLGVNQQVPSDRPVSLPTHSLLTFTISAGDPRHTTIATDLRCPRVLSCPTAVRGTSLPALPTQPVTDRRENRRGGGVVGIVFIPRTGVTVGSLGQAHLLVRTREYVRYAGRVAAVDGTDAGPGDRTVSR